VLIFFQNDNFVLQQPMSVISFDNASIGRVTVDANYRDRKWGHDLMRESIEGISKHFGESKITIGAQLYLKKFYESHGFVQTSEMYLEDDIPHIEMKRGESDFQN
jgi:ElaA protein